MHKATTETASAGRHPNVGEVSVDDVPHECFRPQPDDSASSHPDSATSDAPWPFDSDSSVDREGGETPWTGTTVCNRIGTAFHIRKRDPGRIDQIIRPLNDFPQGYGKVAAIEDLDADFLIYRKFGWLRNYALLHLQDELVDLQQQLERLDKWEFRDGDYKKLLSRRKDYARDDSLRRNLVSKIHSKLAQYDKALLRTQQIQAMKRPTERAQRNLYHLVNNTQSLVDNESQWTAQGVDLAALGRGPEYGWLNTFLEDSMNRVSKRATRAIFRTEEQRNKSGDERLQLLSADRLDILVRIVLTLVAAVLLLIPVAVLFRLMPTSPEDFQLRTNLQMATVFLFTLVFSLSCSIFTKARRQEVFAATAAYSAVLVVFLGNASSGLAIQPQKN
ncbi:hypothetical protein N7G274_005347 [Stereocaulon virgatum]|uniref:DUF6594 domain-containing protein n=1 Tax=Stereocaulon virgatum TaxID=373712 RepID=A0ABR4A9L5_9LECA